MIFAGSKENIKIHQTYVKEFYKGKIKVEFFPLDEIYKTCEILVKLKDHIKTNNFILMFGNVIADPFLHRLAEIHISKEPILTIAFNDKSKLDTKSPTVIPNQSSKEFIAIDEDSNNKIDNHPILHYSSEHFEEEDKSNFISIPKLLLKQYPNLKIYSKFNDLGIYIFSKFVLEILVEKLDLLFDIKDDLIPYLVNNQLLSKFSGKFKLKKKKNTKKKNKMLI